MEKADPHSEDASLGRLGREALRKLIGVGSEVVSELDHEAVLQRVIEAARELTGARYAALGVLDADRRELERFLTSGIEPEAHRAIGDLPRGRGILGVLITDPRPLRLPDVGAHPESYGFPIDHPPMKSFLGVPIIVRGQAWGNLYLTEKEGGDFNEADEEAIVVLARWAATAIQNAHAYRGEREQRKQLERAVRALETTTAITKALGTETDLDRVLELIVKRGRALVEATSMILLLAEGDELVGRAVAGDVGVSVLGLRVPVEDSVVGQAFKTGRSERVADMSARVRFRLGEQVRASTGLVVPLQFRHRRVGVLAAFDRLRDGPEFGVEDSRLIEAFAAAAATAVAGAQDVAAQARQRDIAASERERARWARELHDETLQELGALKLALSAATRLDDLDEVRAALRAAAEQVGEGIQQLRHLVTELRPASLDEIGVQPALEALAERFAAVNDIDVELTVELDFERGRATTRHTPAIETTIYRLVQEALTNVAKHASARRVRVAVVEVGREVEIEITDDGSGFDPSAQADGFGVVGMHERVSLVQGSLDIDSAPGRGTTIRAKVPGHHIAPPLRDVSREAV